MSSDLCLHFSKYFSLSIANNNSLLDEVYRIRYKVYCEELQYEPTSKFTDEKEMDRYDSHSIHYLLQHKPSGQYTGCVRIILPKPDDLKLSFPWQKFYPKLIYTYPQSKWLNLCEISRLAVKSEFRKRKGEDKTPIVGLSLDSSSGKRRFPLITMSLYWTAICLALNLRLDIFAVMEPRLARHLRRFGIRSVLISELFEYHSSRGIFLIKPTELFQHLEPENYQFFRFLNHTIAEDLKRLGYITDPYPLYPLDSIYETVATPDFAVKS